MMGLGHLRKYSGYLRADIPVIVSMTDNGSTAVQIAEALFAMGRRASQEWAFPKDSREQFQALAGNVQNLRRLYRQKDTPSVLVTSQVWTPEKQEDEIFRFG